MKKYKMHSQEMKADTLAIAKGVYQIHEETNNLGPLAAGMLNAKIMEMVEKEIFAKVEKTFVVASIIDPDSLKRISEEIVKDVTVNVLKIAQENNVLKV